MTLCLKADIPPCHFSESHIADRGTRLCFEDFGQIGQVIISKCRYKASDLGNAFDGAITVTDAPFQFCAEHPHSNHAS
jgi:hypothetical protein